MLLKAPKYLPLNTLLPGISIIFQIYLQPLFPHLQTFWCYFSVQVLISSVIHVRAMVPTSVFPGGNSMPFSYVLRFLMSLGLSVLKDD